MTEISTEDDGPFVFPIRLRGPDGTVEEAFKTLKYLVPFFQATVWHNKDRLEVIRLCKIESKLIPELKKGLSDVGATIDNDYWDDIQEFIKIGVAHYRQREGKKRAE